MTPIQQLMLGVGASKKTYMDDVFSTYLYKGTGSSLSINNAIDFGEGGMTWIKSRTMAEGNQIFDTVRGATKRLRTNETGGQETANNDLSAFNNNGFTVISDDGVNNSSHTYSSFSFRKAPGFFDVVTYTGTGTQKTVAHNLGCQPGMIVVKRTDANGDAWDVWHKALGGTGTSNQYLKLNTSDAASSTSRFGHYPDDLPTSTTFTVKNQSGVNADGGTYVAYLFAGGESDAATARSVDFDGSGDYLSWAGNSDFAFGTGAYTVEFWIYPDSLDNTTFFNVAATNGFAVTIKSDNVTITKYGVSNLVETSVAPPIGQWTHYALVREGTGSNQTKIYKNGILEKTGTDSTDWTVTGATGLGANASDATKEWDGKISNFRIVKGTAVYTSSFRPPTEPLTNITNTKLLCCNDSSTTGSTVTPGTITANGDPTASTDSPFDDPAAFTFGENGDQGIIKTGSYFGNENANGPEVFLGFEPQWVFLKNADTTDGWAIFDSMRGVVTGGDDNLLYANTTNAENGNQNYLNLTSTGFKPTYANDLINGDNKKIIYVAIRRPDGYVGKPADAGTDVFTMDTGAGSSTIPNFDSGFPVDFQLALNPAGTSEPRYVGTRLTLGKLMYLNTTDAESGASDHVYDSNVGWNKYSGWGSSYQSWMWKRHAGFDVVTYEATGVAGLTISHSLSKIPEMMWIKRRDGSAPWLVYHKGLDGGTNPETHYLLLNTADAESDSAGMFNDTAPTATYFTVGSSSYANNSDGNAYIAMLFSSVEGISKCGEYSGSNSSQTITVGFEPRFLLMKQSNGSNNWILIDSLRGFGSDGKTLDLNSSAAQGDLSNLVSVSSTGFTLTSGTFNGSGQEWIYYAHA